MKTIANTMGALLLVIGFGACGGSSGGKGTGDAGGGGGNHDANPASGSVMNACLNICMCYSSASDINDCRSDCEKMTVNARLKVNRAFSTGSGSFDYDIFFGSGNTTRVASTACLQCLGSATCNMLDKGIACQTECASLLCGNSSCSH